MSDADPPADTGAPASADGGSATVDTDVASLDSVPAAADPTLAALQGHGQALPIYDLEAIGRGDLHAYDGHVALALDAADLPGMDTMLDLLTVSYNLFDVPAMDIAGGSGDGSAN
jgi:hypothetical protein